MGAQPDFDDASLRGQLLKQLQSEKFDQTATIKLLQENLLISKYLEAKKNEFRNLYQPTEKEILTRYRENPPVRVFQIVRFKNSSRSTSLMPSLLRLKELHETAPSGDSFLAAFKSEAQKISDAFEAPTGGDLDYRPLLKFEPCLQNAYQTYKAQIDAKPFFIPKIINCSQGEALAFMLPPKPLDSKERARIEYDLREADLNQKMEAFMSGMRKKSAL